MRRARPDVTDRKRRRRHASPPLGGWPFHILALLVPAALCGGCDRGDGRFDAEPRAALSRPLDGEPDRDLPAVRSSAAAGARLFAEHCTACHGADGRGDGPLGVRLRPPPPDFGAAAGEIDDAASPARYYSAISRGVIGSSMKRYDHVLDEVERWDTAFFVWGLAADAGTLDRGGRMYAEACARCHDADGRGVTSAPLDRPVVALAGRQELSGRVSAVHPESLAGYDAAARRALIEHLYTFLYRPHAAPGAGE